MQSRQGRNVYRFVLVYEFKLRQERNVYAAPTGLEGQGNASSYRHFAPTGLSLQAGDLSMSNHAQMTGKVCLVTGANSGIGRVTALALARLGAQVVLVCRDRARGEAAMAEIKQATGSRNGHSA